MKGGLGVGTNRSNSEIGLLKAKQSGHRPLRRIARLQDSYLRASSGDGVHSGDDAHTSLARCVATFLLDYASGIRVSMHPYTK